MRTITIRTNDAERITKRIRALLEDPRDLLAKVGAVLSAQAQKAFLEQEFDGEEWPERYPSQEDPFINIAGALSDFSGGSVAPRGRRFDRRPAAMDTKRLFLALDSDEAVRTPSTFVVEVGPDVEYASRVQFGGRSSQPVTQEAKKKIGKWLSRKEGEPYFFKLFFLTGEITELETEVAPRPYLGLTEESRQKIVAILESGPLEVIGPEEVG